VDASKNRSDEYVMCLARAAQNEHEELFLQERGFQWVL